MVGFGEMPSQILIKIGQTRSNLMDGPKNTRFGEIHIQILIIGIEEGGDILVLLKFETNWMVRLREHRHLGTQHLSISHLT